MFLLLSSPIRCSTVGREPFFNHFIGRLVVRRWLRVQAGRGGCCWCLKKLQPTDGMCLDVWLPGQTQTQMPRGRGTVDLNRALIVIAPDFLCHFIGFSGLALLESRRTDIKCLLISLLSFPGGHCWCISWSRRRWHSGVK